MSEPMKHQGGCHCGKVRYEVSLDLGKPVTSCNCSLCSKSGTMLSFVPEDQFTLRSGEGDLKAYQFNKNIITHLFCTTCGIKSFARGVGRDGSKIVAVNVRCVDDVDLDALKVETFDGKHLL